MVKTRTAVWALALTHVMSTVVAEGETPEDLHALLKASDAAIARNFHIEAEVTQPVNPFRGPSPIATYRIQFTVSDETWGKASELLSLRDVSGQSPQGEKGDSVYDRVLQYDFLNDGFAGVRYHWTDLLPSVDGGFKRVRPAAEDFIHVTIYNREFYDRLHLHEQLLWAAGHGFSSKLVRINKVSDAAGGIVVLEAHGTYGRTTEGTWRLELEPANSYRARRAAFTTEGYDRPYAVFENSGNRRWGNIFWPEAGSIEFSIGKGGYADHQVTVRYTGYSSTPDETLLADLRASVQHDYPKGTEVWTYSGDSRRERGVVRTVGVDGERD